MHMDKIRKKMPIDHLDNRIPINFTPYGDREKIYEELVDEKFENFCVGQLAD